MPIIVRGMYLQEFRIKRRPTLGTSPSDSPISTPSNTLYGPSLAI